MASTPLPSHKGARGHPVPARPDTDTVDLGTDLTTRAADIEVSLRLPVEAVAVPLARHLAACAFGEVGIKGAVASDLQVILSELCTNVVDHATGSGTFHVRLALRGGACEIEVTDQGPGPGDVASPEACTELERGRGLSIVRVLADDLLLEGLPGGGARVTVRKLLPAGPLGPAPPAGTRVARRPGRLPGG